MSEEEVVAETPVAEASVAEVALVTNKIAAPEPSPKASVRPAGPTDPRVARRAELKRQKRRTHRHRINASNRPG